MAAQVPSSDRRSDFGGARLRCCQTPRPSSGPIPCQENRSADRRLPDPKPAAQTTHVRRPQKKATGEFMLEAKIVLDPEYGVFRFLSTPSLNAEPFAKPNGTGEPDVSTNGVYGGVIAAGAVGAGGGLSRNGKTRIRHQRSRRIACRSKWLGRTGLEQIRILRRLILDGIHDRVVVDDDCAAVED